MAEPRTCARRWRPARTLLALGAASLMSGGLFGACSGGSSEASNPMLGEICAKESTSCRVEGAAEHTSGLTEELVGLRLSGGKVVLSLRAIAERSFATPSFVQIQVLAARSPGSASTTLAAVLDFGACSDCGAPIETSARVRDEYEWVDVAHFSTPSSAAEFAEDAVLELSGSGIDIAELRADGAFAGGCSIRPLGRMAR